MDKLLLLYEKDRRRFVNIMSAILRQDRAAAEDVVQEAFTRAIRFIDSYDEEKGKFSAWFNTILFNALRDVQKEMRGQPNYSCDGLSAEDLFLDNFLLSSPEFRTFISNKVMEQKNPDHQRVLSLFFLSGYTSTEIAQVEKGVSVSNVTTIVSRFRNEMLEDVK